jgi:hypothetical protein
MKAIAYLTAVGLTAAVAACSQWGSQEQGAQVPFDNGVRQSWSQPTTCSPADATCGSGIGNPSVQSPIQKHEQNTTPY